MKINVAATFGLIAVAALTVGSVQASSVTISAKYTGISGSSNTFDISYGNRDVTTAAGAMNWQRTDNQTDSVFGSTFTTYCIELDESTTTKSKTYDVQSNGTNVLSNIDVTSIGKLWAQYSASELTGNDASAFQLAVWNIVYDTDYTLNSGTLEVDPHDSWYSYSKYNNELSIINTANEMLSWLQTSSANAPAASITTMTNGTYQDQVIGIMIGSTPGEAPSAVPLPAGVWAGLGLMSVLGVSRKWRQIKASR